MAAAIAWLGLRESNPHKQGQRLLSYAIGRSPSALGRNRTVTSTGKSRVCYFDTTSARHVGPEGIEPFTSSGKSRVCDRYTTSP